MLRPITAVSVMASSVANSVAHGDQRIRNLPLAFSEGFRRQDGGYRLMSAVRLATGSVGNSGAAHPGKPLFNSVSNISNLIALVSILRSDRSVGGGHHPSHP
ncbi:exported hypothetical protein [Cupriavidus oxalaticus]|uniref:Uncharacterized protein n=1 Tax=Cupriavidus oxalaticus TaxID=96344 RepID=A0A976GE57_9BURK|nr:exported hypothetical protein [Cupriavidus oxalaticus]